MARPKHLLAYGHPDLFDLAAAYGYGLAKNHPFIDGNKRTAFAVMATFLLVNGYLLDVAEKEVVQMMELLSESVIATSKTSEIGFFVGISSDQTTELKKLGFLPHQNTIIAQNNSNSEAE